ncbi:hypothetical protein COLO4_35619 [Corchorus olitorius]|uniref:Uncharacterized protein n=1 Tax=Corchorus olitorius TaxID=93759 RepID=A0A1R3GEM4_9ROSI|nr:hypothetical protein COLO4_35619 [Corchorus olitorius]
MAKGGVCKYAITANPNTWNMGKTHKKTRCILPAGILFGKREVVTTRRIAGGFGESKAQTEYRSCTTTKQIRGDKIPF